MTDNTARVRAYLPGSVASAIRGIRSKIRRHNERKRHARMGSKQFHTSSQLVQEHFKNWVPDDYQVVEPGIQVALAQLMDRPSYIVETGTSAWGVDSTRIFDRYVHAFGGGFWSVDIRTEPRARLLDSVSQLTSLEVGDSVDFLSSLSEILGPGQLDLAYLDSWDLDWSSPIPAEEHCLREWQALRPLLRRGSVVIIDDTPRTVAHIPPARPRWIQLAEEWKMSHGYTPGKGAGVLRQISRDGSASVLWHGYNLVLTIDNP